MKIDFLHARKVGQYRPHTRDLHYDRWSPFVPADAEETCTRPEFWQASDAIPKTWKCLLSAEGYYIWEQPGVGLCKMHDSWPLISVYTPAGVVIDAMVWDDGRVHNTATRATLFTLTRRTDQK